LPRFQKEMLEENYKIVELVKEIANSHNATPAQIALAWILHQKPYIIPIPGTTKAHRIQENLGAIDVELTKDELEKLNKISENWNNMGDRYPEHLEALTNK
ncbi:aldo/keto reductase, partial [bacterium]|nr:aldo/keto reductase [bacterium]